ncbi:hypothetical protein PR202_ga30959 [Eleusine coracana subsp. coracana]|uniref:Small ribosomal subunit protein uS7 domain-containing protein n=1 Tax=Eleusine coracana subsp. coracana TaxID=191504 RepID=A0AAV5DQ46_ELECO|nr:hypothetical protein PR202_ga30959 [Eleusine coracana subsp. coracana]
MIDGKRTRVRAIVYKTFHRLARTERDVIKLMVDAVDNIKPICDVVKVGVAGTIYDVPGDCSQGSSTNLSYSLDPWSSFQTTGDQSEGGDLNMEAGFGACRQKKSMQMK